MSILARRNSGLSLSINEIYELARTGDRSAEERLFERLRARFRLFAEHKIREAQDAEEVVQDALLTVAEKYKDIEFEVSFAAWAHQVLNNKLLSFYKSQSRRVKRQTPMIEEGSVPPPPQADPLFESQLLDCLRKVCLANPRHARILNLHYHGYSVAEICERLGLTRTNFYSILSRARSMLENCLQKGDVR